MPDITPQFGIQFQSIEVLSYRLDPLLPTETKPSVGFQISMTHRFDGEQERAQIELDIQIVNVENQQSVGELKTCCTFMVKGLQFDNDQQNVTVDSQFLDMVNSISLSTTRGILFTYFAKTHLNPLVLPIINPKDFRPSPDLPTPEPIES